MQNEDLQRTDLELVQLKNNYTDLFEFSPAACFLLDDGGVITKVNHAGAKLFGVDKTALVNKTFSRYITPDFQNEFSQYKKRLLKQSDFHSCEVKLLQRNKPLFYAQLEGKSSTNPNTGRSELLIMIGKISSRKQTEEAGLESTHELSSIIGELAHPMVNELNQPLAIIANYIYGCIHRLENNNYDTGHLLQAMKQAELELHRTAEIILRMKNYTHKDIYKQELTCINSVVEEIIDLINYEIISYPVSIQFRPNKGLPKLMLDRIHIQQVILHLARNAIEAMKDAHIVDPKLIIEINRPNKDNIEISVIDNGPAFKLENTHKLFEPNFTTKPYGIGLGLIISRTIVESHGGKLLVELNVTQGACFKIVLPIRAIQ